MGWRVSSYVLSKGVAAGAMMLALALIAGADGAALADVAPGLLAMAGIAYALSVAARLDAEDARDVLAWAMVSDGIRPGIVAASHHMGRWRLKDDEGVQRWASALVDVQEEGAVMRFRQIPGVQPWESSDPSSQRVWWNDAGVHQNITFPVHRDPISGVHCWQQMVRLSSAHTEDRYIDTDKRARRLPEVPRPRPAGRGGHSDDDLAVPPGQNGPRRHSAPTERADRSGTGQPARHRAPRHRRARPVRRLGPGSGLGSNAGPGGDELSA